MSVHLSARRVRCWVMDGSVGGCNGNGGRVLKRYIPAYQADGKEDIVMNMRIGVGES